jgi:hypothetical protein
MATTAFSLDKVSSRESFSENDVAGFGITWFEGIDVCALADSERHLGHAFRDKNGWRAYDGVHPNRTQNEFLCLGYFPTVQEARRAIESSVFLSPGRRPLTRTSALW